MSKAFDRRVWHKSLLSKLPSYGFYPSLCTFISSFLSDRSISAVVDVDCSTPKTINSGVPQGSVLSSTLILLFINNLLSCTQSNLHNYADDSTLHYSTFFFQPKTNKTGVKSLKAGSCKALNLWSYYYFRLGQKELSVLQYLINPFPSLINSTTSSR